MKRKLLYWIPLIAALLFVSTLSLRAQTPPDLASSFDASMDDWRASDAGATLAWQSADGNPGGYLRANGPGGVWYLVSPTAWAGNWSAYRALKFDLAIPSRHYADSDSAGMVVIVGTNANTMTWIGPTPLWTWTHYEISLDAASFGVDQATFDGIMAGVAEVRILGEFTTAGETVGLDNVLVTATPVTVHSENLVERFTGAVKSGKFVAGWGPVDDVTLYPWIEGRPLHCLYCDDWQDGRIFKIVSPVTWAGDWRNFTEIRFDLKWSSSGSGVGGANLLQIFGANGEVLNWNTTLTEGVWQHIVVSLTPATFGVDAATFESVMEYVNKIWIRGEYDDGDDQLWLDNVVVATGPETPHTFATSLISRFGSDAEGWVVFDGATLGRDETGGFTGAAITCTDTGAGTARFCSPDDWSGDWSNFQSLRFMLRTYAGYRGTYSPTVTIYGVNQTNLSVAPPPPYSAWCPYTIDLTPATFGVSQAEFDAVISNVACVTIVADLIGGNDTTGLDDVSLLAHGAFAVPPPEHLTGFDADAEGWRKGGESGGEWGILSADVEYRTNGNPAGCIAVNDDYNITYWFSPAAWAGDWRGYESVAFDLKILNGSDLLGPGTMLAVISAQGTLLQPVTESPALGQWNHYEFALTPAAFGVTQQEFDTIMRDVAMLAIRSEWIIGGETEALDNVRVSKAPEAYWLWLSGYLDGADLGNEAIAGKSADADMDGLNNWGEFIAGTNPTNALDLLRIERVAVTTTNCWLDFSSRTGRLYGIETTPELSPTSVWTEMTNDIPGTGLLMTIPSSRSEAARFYRLKVR